MPSPWYSQLVRYKTVDSSLWPNLAALTYVFLATHAPKIEAMLGGRWDLIALVPSTRGRTYQAHPLRRALALSAKYLAPLMQPAITHVAGTAVQRHSYETAAFQVDRAIVGERRVLLIEDTWASGSKAVSAAGALLEAGARSVAILPIARAISSEYWEADHPYWEAMRRPYDVTGWPR